MNSLTEDLFFNISTWSEWCKERFPNKDIVSLEDLLTDYDDALFEIKKLKERVEELEEEIDDYERGYSSLHPRYKSGFDVDQAIEETILREKYNEDI